MKSTGFLNGQGKSRVRKERKKGQIQTPINFNRFIEDQSVKQNDNYENGYRMDRKWKVGDDFEETPENFVQDIRDLIKAQKEKQVAQKMILESGV